MTSARPLILVSSIFLLTLGTLAGCQTISPWERGHLAHPCMQPPVDEVEHAFQSHVQVVREGSIGGASAAGGGCGCN